MMRVYGNGERRKDDAVSKCRRLTKRALDRWDSLPFSGIFLASSFLCSQALSTPAHLPVTQTVRRHVSDFTMDSDSISASRRSRWKSQIRIPSWFERVRPFHARTAHRVCNPCASQPEDGPRSSRHGHHERARNDECCT